VSEGLAARLQRRLRLRCLVVTHEPGTLPRTETGKAKRLFERTDDTDPW
jgi:phenylacetate-coenzyme A ligase PaaK-like adenylate-forming protein